MDVYYWPVTGANSDCVSIVGSTYNDYVSELLTTDNRGYPYWKAQTNPWGQNCSQNLGSITLPPEQALDGAPNALSAATNIIQYRDYSPKNITSAANISTAEAIATIGDFRWYAECLLDCGRYVDQFSVPLHLFASVSAISTRPMHVAHCQLTASWFHTR